MSRLKKVLKAKEPVALRFRMLSKGSKSLYLDTYWNGKRHYEFLKLYLIPERTEEDKLTNQIILKAANAIKAERTRALIMDEAGLKKARNAILLEDWLVKCQRDAERIALSKGRTHAQYAKSYLQTLHILQRFLKETEGGEVIPVRVADIDKNFLMRFHEWLDTVPSVKNGKPLSGNTKHQYSMLLSTALNKAVKKELIPKNPMLSLEQGEKPPKIPSKREFLTQEELKVLAATDGNPRITQPFLFSCFCGLRLSDMATLKWGELHQSSNQWFIEKRLLKTQQLIYLPISNEALRFLPPRYQKSDDDFIFDLQLDDGFASKYIARWVRKAGIKKHITFHCARHTFATLMLTLGVDLYTTSKLLGHNNIKTTQIYAKIIDRKKIEAVSLINGILG